MNEHNTDTLSKFGPSFQISCLSGLVSDKVFTEQIADILEPSIFQSESHQYITNEILKYFREYKELPTLAVFKIKLDALKNEELKSVIITQLKLIYTKITDTDLKFIKEQFLDFCKNQKLKSAILKSVDYLDNGQYDKIKHAVDEAMKAGMERNIGHEYINDIEHRMSMMARDTISTGLGPIDRSLDGGLASGELATIIGISGGGKSWLLAKIGAEAMKQGKNVMHFTLELNENYVGLRYDACFTGIDFQNIRNNIQTVKDKIADVSGKLIIKFFPVKTVSSHTLKSHVERVQALGTKIDIIILDYADLLRTGTASGGNSYQDGGNIYEELRGIAGELGVPIWTCAQSNRGGASVDIITSINIGDSFRKVQTADYVLSISRNLKDKTTNTAKLHICKSRFGKDGITYPAIVNMSNGEVHVYEDDSPEGLALQSEMDNEENNVKKTLYEKLKSHNNRQNDSSLE